MNNGPWRGAGVVEAGGMEDLQTDVMRFMAILAFCLVAVFALVQSMPMHAPPVAFAAPVPSSPAPVEATPVTSRSVETVPVEAAPTAAVAPAPSISTPPLNSDAWSVGETAPAAERQPAPTAPKATPERRPAERSSDDANAPIEEAEPNPRAVAAPAMPTSTRMGFTLRFATDEALIRLVREGSVGLYALSGDQAWRMRTRGAGLLFAPSARPPSLRIMSPATIPDTVREALSLSVGSGAEGAEIGVTLPPQARAELDAIFQRHRGGDIVIAETGRLRLEQTS